MLKIERVDLERIIGYPTMLLALEPLFDIQYNKGSDGFYVESKIDESGPCIFLNKDQLILLAEEIISYANNPNREIYEI